MYVGEGSKREQSRLLSSWLAFSHFLCYPQSNWALLVLILRWVGLCMFWDPVGLSNELSCEAGSFPCCCRLNPTGVFNQWFEALFPHAGTVGCAVYGWVHQLPPCCESSLPCLPIPAPPTGLDGCFFFISLVVRLPYSSILSILVVFVFKLLLSFFWLCEEAQCVYLCLHLGQELEIVFKSERGLSRIVW